MDIPTFICGGHPKKWATKSALAKDLNEQCRRVNFGLFGVAWIAVRGLSALMPSGHWMPIFETRLHTGWVIGPRDLAAGDQTKHAEGWRNALIDDNLSKGE